MMLLCLVVNTAAAQTQADFCTTVTNLWYQGHKSNVLAMANVRLQENTNDMAGLIIKVEYDIDFTQRNNISNSVSRALAVGRTITTIHFAEVFPEYEEDLLSLLDEVKENPLSGTALDIEQAKGHLKHHKFLARKELEALQKDGYFDQ